MNKNKSMKRNRRKISNKATELNKTLSIESTKCYKAVRKYLK